MPPVAKKDAMLIVFDLKSSKKDQLLEGLLKIVTHKHMVTKDICHILLANSVQTDNAMEIRNVLITDIDGLYPKDVYECIRDAEVSDMVSTNFLDILLLASHYAQQASGVPGVVNKQIVYFTSLENQPQEEQQDSLKLKKIIKELNENEIFLYIVGPDATLPFSLIEPKDIHESMKKVMVDESNKALVTAKEIVQQCERSVLCNINIGTSLVHFFRKHQGSQPWLVPISIGNNMTIPVKTQRIITRNVDVKLVDLWKEASNIFILEEDAGVELDFKDLIKGVIRHEKFVKIDDGDMFKFDTERAFNVIGFTENKFVPEAYVTGEGTFIVLPGCEADDDNYALFLALIKVLAEDDKCAIMQRVYNKNNFPKLFVLKPVPEANPPHFVMTTLPHADDMVVKDLKVLKPNKLDCEIEDDDFVAYCKNIDVFNDSCTIDWPLAPTLTKKIFDDKVVKLVLRKLCQKNFEFDQTEPYDFDTKQNIESWDKLKESWPEATESSQATQSAQ